jgi:hypothetical protein
MIRYCSSLRNLQKTFTGIVIAILLFTVNTFSQEAPTAAGGDAIGTGGSMAFSVGQVIYTTKNNPSFTITQGVQQPYEIFPVGILKADANFKLSAYPNPTYDNLLLEIESLKQEQALYRLTDVNGRLILSGVVAGNITSIPMSMLAAATYFLHVEQQKTVLQTFRIVKTDNY